MAPDARSDDAAEPAATQAVPFNPFEPADTGTQAATSEDFPAADTTAATTSPGPPRAAVTARTSFPVPRGRVLVPERGAARVHDRRPGSEPLAPPRILDTEPTDHELGDPTLPEPNPQTRA